ncbi:hypothetical protein L9F63_016794, partial [Diploptera punctata]
KRKLKSLLLVHFTDERHSFLQTIQELPVIWFFDVIQIMLSLVSCDTDKLPSSFPCMFLKLHSESLHFKMHTSLPDLYRRSSELEANLVTIIVPGPTETSIPDKDRRYYIPTLNLDPRDVPNQVYISATMVTQQAQRD